MPKELRLEVAVAVPDDILEQADVIAKAKPLIRTLMDGLLKECGADNVRGDVTLVTPRGATKGDADAPSLLEPAPTARLKRAVPAPEGVANPGNGAAERTLAAAIDGGLLPHRAS